jgi:hypothetical protein
MTKKEQSMSTQKSWTETVSVPQEVTAATTEKLRCSNWEVVSKVHRLLNFRKLRFWNNSSTPGVYVMVHRDIDGQPSKRDFGPDRIVAIAVNLDTLKAQVCVFRAEDHPLQRTDDWPTPLQEPVEIDLTPGNHVKMANKLEKILTAMHRVHTDD